MTLLSTIHFEDVKDSPSLKVQLPAPLPIGTKLTLNHSCRRRKGGRTEELKLDGEFKVLSSTISVDRVTRQVVTLIATGVAPSWRAIKNQPRKLTPARAPKTEVT